MSTLPISSSMPVLDATREPDLIRHGDTTAQNAYRTGLAFEKMLTSQLTQQMTQTLSGAGSGDDGLGGSTDDGTGFGGSDAAAGGGYSSMLPDALSSGLTSGGGTGVAMQVARALDPALNESKATS